LGFGGGFVDRNLSNQDIKFAKVSYRNEWQSVKYIVSTQWQSFQGKDYPGGYVAPLNKELMDTWGSDGEQWRSTFGYVAPDQGPNKLRPALEVFYVDNTIGQVNGSKDMMVTGSLGFRKVFLGHEARLGRAMGPTGVEFFNPLGYLPPNFNRRLTALGSRGIGQGFIHKALPNAGREETLETAVYPGQLLGVDSLINALFVGVGGPVQIRGNTASAACWVTTNASRTLNRALGCNTILTPMTPRSFSTRFTGCESISP
jgi:hypothetical protein